MVLTDLMRDIDIPNGVGAVGFGEGDVPDLVEGTMKQQRLLATCPREVTEDDVAGIFLRSMSLWGGASRAGGSRPGRATWFPTRRRRRTRPPRARGARTPPPRR